MSEFRFQRTINISSPKKQLISVDSIHSSIHPLTLPHQSNHYHHSPTPPPLHPRPSPRTPFLNQPRPPSHSSRRRSRGSKIEFMRPLGKETKRQHSSTTTTTSQSVSQSLSHPPINHHPRIVTIFRTTSTIINHSSQSCIQVAGVRTSAVFPESVHEVIVSVELVAYIAPPYCTNGSTARAAQTKRITTTTNQTQPRSTRASSSKWQCQRKGGAPNHSHINLPHTDARKVSNRIDDATRAKPRSEEGGGEVCNEVNAD